MMFIVMWRLCSMDGILQWKLMDLDPTNLEGLKNYFKEKYQENNCNEIFKNPIKTILQLVSYAKEQPLTNCFLIQYEDGIRITYMTQRGYQSIYFTKEDVLISKD